MNHSIEIELHNGAPVDSVAIAIRQEAAKLDKLYNRIAGCRVDVEFSAHPRRGTESTVRLELQVPIEDASTPAGLRGGEVVDAKELWKIESKHKNAISAVHSAFFDARRRLEEFTTVRTSS